MIMVYVVSELYSLYSRSWVSIVGTAAGYGLDDREVGSSSVGRVNNFLFSMSFKTGSGVHLTSYPMGVQGDLSQWVKRPGREGYHSLPASAEVKNMRIYTSTFPYAFMA
jgi:hypothetical protein